MEDPSSDPGASAPSDAAEPSSARVGSPPLEAGLYVVATPIGNLRDITLRALDVLSGADRIFAEDTRVTAKLLTAHGIRTPLASYHEHNAEAARGDILARLDRGERVALVSDAGTPLISDPGYKLARAVIEAGHKVIPIPGASAVLAALAGAGLATDRFLFAGFPPAKAQARETFLAALRAIPATLVFYESGPRLGESLAAMAQAFGPREGVIARELTKLFEEFRRAPLDELAGHYARAGAPKGEIVVLVAPPVARDPPSAEEIDAALRAALARASVKDAAQEVADALGVPRRDAYLRALALKDQRA